jgi:hypothetical protein
MATWPMDLSKWNQDEYHLYLEVFGETEPGGLSTQGTVSFMQPTRTSRPALRLSCSLNSVPISAGRFCADGGVVTRHSR